MTRAKSVFSRSKLTRTLIGSGLILAIAFPLPAQDRAPALRGDVDRDGSVGIIASSAGRADTLQLTVEAGTPASLTLLGTPSPSAQSGTVLFPQPVVELRDASGNPMARAGVPVTASLASGGGVGTRLPTAPAAVVRDASGNPVAGVSVTFSVASGGGSVAGTTMRTAASGIATAAGWTLGSTVGSQALSVSAAGITAPVTITATATAAAPHPPQGPTVYVIPEQSLFDIAAAAAEGVTFVIRPGVHRLRGEIYAKSGQSFIGEPGAILSGARLLTSFSREGSYWVAAGQAQFAPTRGIGQCRAGFERCGYSEQLFIDDVPLRHVGSVATVGPGRWFFDYDADKIYFYDDPTGRKVETSVRLAAFTGDAADVTIRGLTIEKFATPAGWGAVHPWDGAQGSSARDWLVENNLIRWNQGGATKLVHGMRLLNNRLVSNGQLGIQGLYADGALVEGNEIAYNNTAGYSWIWEAGGTKFVQTDGLVVRNNHVHDNYGPGLWTDIDNIRTLYEGNLVEDNENAGIFHEISYSAIIRNNTVRRNGFGYTGAVMGAGILIAGSSDVEVYGNILSDNADGIGLVQQVRGTGIHGPYEVRNVYVHHNTIAQATGTTGAFQIGDPEIFNRNNRFEANIYHLSGTAKFFTWMNADVTDAQWRSYGQDASGVFNR